MKTKKFNLGFLPTPLHELHQFSRKYTPGYRIFIKRDDHTGLASGGNKTRKLEYLIGAALQQGADTVIASGAQQSNHCRQTAAACAMAGLECHLMLGGEEPKVKSGNLLLSYIFGARIHYSGEKRKGEDAEILVEKLRSAGNHPYLIPYGGSNATGALGYVEATLELQEQLKTLNLQMDYIFFASSSGGMQAGIAMGKAMYGLHARLMPIRIDKEPTVGKTPGEMVSSIINEARERYGLNAEVNEDDLKLLDGYEKPGYGVITANEKKAILALAGSEGILLDPVYTGRAFYGLMHQIENKLIPRGSNILFWHTGGLPATFQYAAALI
ncbi:MAG: D-cysteine desulfhydrase family protein [Bacteroidia bacterium]|nr:MAG: D-cysteine desulfhydrase family protein [Bacteroidia bacterium]